MERKYYIAGFVFGLLGIVIGAFGTHGLKPLLSPDSYISLETGIKYQIYHSLLLLILGIIITSGYQLSKAVFYLIVIGIILFSGSIYLLATNDLTIIDFKGIAFATPLGGSLLIIAWGWLLVQFIKLKKK
ncbi:uncharacterized membrane protein YgdD (TMEM256/DUF423 family) [Gillisia mitskevichiae]|uniref:Uncharacterized membrane protein YgdD (TMEM256/DUF423 family) n=1 Tax=Gillisia mitskevichiae TaxID=270921 RepID=A0A495PY33_9FLAO|nr:DUF423 domain-containing protein [Gillisia mitskevichiae]RKS55828.1 uncharacterized membrane protein YgdD (TMEM256/DUF423 family) [Gillisia mitskevichiae]